MKTIKNVVFAVLALTAALISGPTSLFGQTNLQFTSINATPEKAIQLYWSSVSNEVYEIDKADALNGNPDGSTAWKDLYDNYPSQGTNTFIGDFGNYTLNPFVLNPNQRPMRFYRVVDTGPSTGEIPIVTITSITNGAPLSDQITVLVTATSSLSFVTTALYVDGQKMNNSDDGSNYIINTCEWLNGPHVLYATAQAQSTLSGPPGSFPVTIGRGVSPFVNVTFNNLISEIAFSQPFFQPSLGQTQQVTASFAANVDWTLQVLDESSNAVRTVTGSGTSLLFDWDGTGDGETNIPDGVYYYSITAQTNGEAFSMLSSMASGRLGSATALSDEPVQLWALSPDGSAPFPLAIYPPGFDTNGLEIFEATPSQVRALSGTVMSAARPARTVRAGTFAANDSGGGATPDAGYASSSQTSIAPTRPSTSPVKNSSGDIGVAFFDHSTTNHYVVPLNGLGLPGNGGKVKLDSGYGNVELDPIVEAGNCANDFVTRMKGNGWWGPNSFNLSGGTLHVNDLRKASLGGNEIFGQVNVGLLIDHGNYGTTMDYNSDANESLDTYFAGDNPSDGSAPWLRLSELGTGGNLRWIGILACNILRNQNYNSMKNLGVLPIKSNLHLICSASTYAGCGDVGGLWASKMNRSIFLGGPETVRQAWYDAGQQGYSDPVSMSGWSYGAIIFRVAGQDNCLDDTLRSYPSTTSGNITEDHHQVYP